MSDAGRAFSLLQTAELVTTSNIGYFVALGFEHQ
jgi:hypothetical protein